MQNTFRDKASNSRRYFPQIASQQAEIKCAQKLRYQVFAEEMGARIHCTETGVDSDAVDEYCDHLLVHDVKTGAVVACTRLLSDIGARRLGYFYSEGEFHLDGVLASGPILRNWQNLYRPSASGRCRSEHTVGWSCRIYSFSPI